ncbi:MAG: hypothetical protein QOF39_3155, partial [Frankiales bacterium]|nr:hypothetical protein [Frankiales bacterium]
MKNNENPPAAGFSRGSTSARERARHRVRTFTAVGAAGAIAGTAVLTAGLALSPS